MSSNTEAGREPASTNLVMFCWTLTLGVLFINFLLFAFVNHEIGESLKRIEANQERVAPCQ